MPAELERTVLNEPDEIAPELNELNFDTGLREFSINGAIKVAFNPTDGNFVEKLYDMFERLDKKQVDYEDRRSKTADKRALFALARERDTEMRNEIDGLFGLPVCDAVFGQMNVFAMASGLPVWSNLMLTIMDQIDTTFAREQKATNPRLAKYLDKYKKK